MDTTKIIKGVVGGGRYTVTAPIIKEDYGLYLKIEGLELPETYQVDFSNSEHNGTSVTMIGNADGVLIPHQFIDTGKDVFAFLYHVGEDYGRTVFKFRIPNKCRPDRTNEEPTPEEQSVIDQAISALNSAVAQTAQDVISADQSAQSASQFAEDARDAEARAAARAATAQNYANNAQASATASAQSAEASARCSSDAQDSAEEAKGYAQRAEDALEEFTTPTASATTLQAGSSATASYANGRFSFGIPRGDKGERGERGLQGERGIQGIQGIQGERGLQGERGEKGDTGIGEKGDKGDTGDTGERGTGILKVTTAPTSYTTQTGGFTPKFRIALSTVQSQAYVDEVLIGDVISHSYNLYHVGYVDDTYAYLSAATSIRGAKGSTGAQGPAGSDASVTSANIESALGYVPVSQSSVDGSVNRLINKKNADNGDVLTYDSTVSESKPYPWSWAPAPGGTTLLSISSDDAAGIYYVISQLKAAADNSGVASMSVPFDAGSAFLSNIYGIYQNNKTPIIVVQGASPNPIIRYLAINNLWAESLETGVSGAEMGCWDGMYHIEFEIGTSTLTLIVEKKG